jgi:hypothetical protein
MSEELSPTAKEVLQELEPGTRFENKIILSKRQLLSIAGAGLSAGALAKFGISEAQAQEAAGQVGTSSEPVDLFAANYGSTSTADGYELTVEGDTYQFNE